jgi:hypothetical protein
MNVIMNLLERSQTMGKIRRRRNHLRTRSHASVIIIRPQHEHIKTESRSKPKRKKIFTRARVARALVYLALAAIAIIVEINNKMGHSNLAIYEIATTMVLHVLPEWVTGVISLVMIELIASIIHE